MKKRYLLSSAAIGVLSTFFAYFLVSDSDVHAQTSARSINKTASVKTTNKNSSRFAHAAARNLRLRSSLQWAFGGKTQIGWNIYVPLISHTIGTDTGPDTAEFAFAVSKWQEDRGLTANGIVDRETLESFTKYWQSRRLGRAGLSSAD